MASGGDVSIVGLYRRGACGALRATEAYTSHGLMLYYVNFISIKKNV